MDLQIILSNIFSSMRHIIDYSCFENLIKDIEVDKNTILSLSGILIYLDDQRYIQQFFIKKNLLSFATKKVE